MACHHVIAMFVLQCIMVCAFCFPGTESMEQKPTCGYESCNKEKPGMINVHLVPHTHDDPGWTITVDQYYYKQVQWILDGVVAELKSDPNKRFIYVEQAFFTRWWRVQNDEMKNDVKKLVNEGRLEFILGGWSMTDEASTHYTAIIDDHKIGFEFLRQNFGECGRPRIGWQIDPFGHAREQASIFAQFGFDGLFFARLDYQDKAQREQNKTMEFVWEASPNNLGAKSNLFTGVLPDMYNPPDGFCFDISCFSWNPMIKDDPTLHDYNVNEMVDKFIKEVNKQAAHYRTKHLIMTMGSDFNYVQAHMFFKEIDKLIKYVNARQSQGSKINLLYSTPSCYVKELNNDNLQWATKQDDFFPYADRAHTFWSGYFTSRITLKYFSRTVNNLYQSAKQMAVLAGAAKNATIQKELHHIGAVVGLSEHHDAITGTEKQVVAYDYAQRLSEGVTSGKVVIQNFYDDIMSLASETPVTVPEQVICGNLNISICSVTTSGDKDFQVTLYNPLARSVQYATRIPVMGSTYSVFSPLGKVWADIFPVSNETKVLSPYSSKATHELVFVASLPAVGYASYFVQKSSGHDLTSRVAEPSGDTVLSGKYVRVMFDSNGHMSSMRNTESNIEVPLQQNFFYYLAHGGECTSDTTKQPSGAYIFRPADGNNLVKINLTKWQGVYNGKLVQEARQKFGDWASQVVRVYQDKPYVEVEYTIGPVPLNDNVGKEVVTRYNIPGFGNKGVFYTDSNGREILERRLDYRATWKLNQTEPVAGNYFPVNALIAIKNKDLQFTVLTDRSHGGSSLNDGDVELMLHRRLVRDDCKGVGEALNETAWGKGLMVRGKQYLLLDKVSQAARKFRPLAKDVFYQPTTTFSGAQVSPSVYFHNFTSNYTGLHSTFMENLHLLTLEAVPGEPVVPSPAGTVPFLFRIEHFYETGEDATLSKPVTFDLKTLLYPYAIGGVNELALGGNILAKDVHRLKWRTENNKSGDQNIPLRLDGYIVTLNPMEIITLQVDIFVN